MKRLALVALFATAPATVAAQTTAELLVRGIKAYEELNLEQARPIFAQIVSPSYINPVTLDQRVQAYKYLGASWAVLTELDSALRYFVAALGYDAFTDLDPVKFSAAELGPFSIAKSRVFGIGMRSVKPAVVNPRDSIAYRFIYVTTHMAAVRVTLTRQNDPTAVPEIIYDARTEGERVIPWNGRLTSKGGAVADSGTYLLNFTATSTLSEMRGEQASKTELLRIEQSYEPLEDPLPPLPDTLLLPEKIKTQEPFFDLANGILIGAAAYVLPAMILKTDPVLTAGGFNWKPHAVISLGISVASGMGSFFYRSSRRAIDANVRENTRRRLQRENYNRAIAVRNLARTDAMLLIITPLSAR